MWICIAFSRNILASKALRYDTCYTRVDTVLPATKHEPYLFLIHNCIATPHFGQYSLCLLSEGRDDQGKLT